MEGPVAEGVRPSGAADQPPLVAVVGPTATGKSDLGVALALALGGEVVNADASQLYRGMDVGTAKLPVAERRGVPHHQLDVLDVREEASVAAYQRAARAAVADVRARGLVPVLVGGSGLYVRAVLDPLEFPGTDPDVRARWQAEADRLGAPALHARLAELDPAAAAAVLPTNERRVVRALEAIEVSGRPFSATMPRYEHPPALEPVVQVGLRLPRPELDDRVARRVRAMADAGLVEEVRRLVDGGLREGRTAPRALGYAQVLDHLDGRCTLEEALAATTAATRRFARRQESWFRRDPRVRWLDVDDDADDLLRRALREVEAALPPVDAPADAPVDAGAAPPPGA
ncbi:tRNA (adenosine(37)-N6)-dimethylallyltransferase MiaA [Pseudokineococcus marinus]|uniref:tRNA (adenosine(37)-N6)-dimethylallyltransferase MiaA n=1 Tax=Pseudokineococcus marinus TaxID=351215 RepID=UPI002ADE2AF4|nr:tRNA (adenosine(37)-N6)-dimethylallyltransferase MiaA [Pseudokineococcus marinus]